MAIKIGINGYGRIGRNIVRAIHELGRRDEFDVVALNDLGDAQTNAHLTRRDSAHGPFPGTVDVDGDDIIVNGDRIKVFAERDPAKLPWGELGVDVVYECTGLFRTREAAVRMSWLTPYTMVASTSLPPGAEMMTFFAPPSMCLPAASRVRNSPVHS